MTDTINLKLISEVNEFGWHVLLIPETDIGPGFCYSVGLFKTFNHPEIVIVGLDIELGHVLINNMGEEIRNGKQFETGKFYPEILDNFECYFLEVNKENYDDYFGRAQTYYDGDDFPVLQCIYPTVKGIFPWEEEWPEDLLELQPILGDFEDN